MPIKTILVPVDFSDASLQALDRAVGLARPFKAKLVVLSVLEPIHFATPAHLYAPAVNLGMVLEEQERMAREQLARVEGRLAQRRVQCRTMLRTGSAAEAITDTATQLGADLIVMATHGRTGLSRLLMGSVAERVVHSAGCPVLTFRAAAAPKRTRRRTSRARA